MGAIRPCAGLRPDRGSRIRVRAANWNRIKSARRDGQAGQALVELAIVAPVLLLILGVALDFARVYQRWVVLEAATRDAAQYIATNTDALRIDWTGTDADTKARQIMAMELGLSFTTDSSQASCSTTAGKVATTVSAPVTTTAAGGSTSNPVQTVRVVSCIGFAPLFSYPFVTQNGVWIVRGDSTYSTAVGR